MARKTRPKVTTFDRNKKIEPINNIKIDYDPIKHPHSAFILCKQHGMTLEDLAEVFGVSCSILKSWMIRYPELETAICSGMDDFDSKVVEKRLLKVALGYDYEEVTIKESQDKFGNPITDVTTAKKHRAPDVSAIKFWLTNRRKDRWKQESNINTNQSGTIEHINKSVKVTADLSKMDLNQLKALRTMVALQQKQGEIVDLNSNAIDFIDLDQKKNK